MFSGGHLTAAGNYVTLRVVMAQSKGLALLCFGAPTASIDGATPPPVVLWRKHLALLVYLALSPDRRRQREHLIGLLWGESTQDKARRSLNAALNRLRGCLGEGRLVNDGASVVLDDHGLDVDALRFVAVAERAPHEAVLLLRGKFLEGFHVDEAPEFEEWMAAERRRIDQLAATALTAAANRDINERRLVAATDRARRALELEPHSDKAIIALMRALLCAGDSGAALAAFHEFSDRLEREMHERPSKAVADLAELIRKHAPPSPHADPGPSDEPALVGRESLHREVFETLQTGLTGGARTVLIAGPPGMGRTRLLRECRDDGRTSGALFVSVRPLESDHDARWSTLRQLFRDGLGDAPGLLATRAEALGTLATLIPELAARFPQREARDIAEISAALATALAAIADEKPLLLAIDDAHWADGATLAALHAALGSGSLKHARVVLVLTVAHGVGTPPLELQHLQADVARSLRGISIRLGPLNDQELRTLVFNQARWCTDDADRDRLARRLVVETGGIPFFAVTLLGALERATQFRNDIFKWPLPGRTIDAPLPFSLPDVVKYAVQLRLGELSKHETAVLSAGSIGGPGLDLELIAALTDHKVEEVEVVLPGLERRQLIQFNGQRYSFVAPLVAEVVRAECLTRGQLRQLKGRAIAALAERRDLESRVLRCELLADVAPDRQSFTEAAAAAREAKAAGGSRLARRAEIAAQRMAEAAGFSA